MSDVYYYFFFFSTNFVTRIVELEVYFCLESVQTDTIKL